jgi:hypothetical protein
MNATPSTGLHRIPGRQHIEPTGRACVFVDQFLTASVLGFHPEMPREVLLAVEALKKPDSGPNRRLRRAVDPDGGHTFPVTAALVRCITNTNEDAAVPEDLGLLNIPVLDLDSGARSMKTADP